MKGLDLALGVFVTITVGDFGEQFERPGVSDRMAIKNGAVSGPRRNEEVLKTEPKLFVVKGLGSGGLRCEVVLR